MRNDLEHNQLPYDLGSARAAATWSKCTRSSARGGRQGARERRYSFKCMPRRLTDIPFRLNAAVAGWTEAALGPMRVHLPGVVRSEEHTSELQSLMRIPYAVFCLKQTTKKANKQQ